VPTFDYCCNACGEVTLDVRRKRADPQPSCKNCGSIMTKLPSAPGLSFKGSGWAKDGYQKRGDK
jgi:putative FmdB family regulatory protein